MPCIHFNAVGFYLWYTLYIVYTLFNNTYFFHDLDKKMSFKPAEKIRKW